MKLAPQSPVAVAGAGPAGLTVAWLLARAGHRVVVLEKETRLGGLWAPRRGADGSYESENSCKVYQATYETAPALFRALGTRWEEHFVPRHDLVRDWIRPFVAESDARDLAKIGLAFVQHRLRLRDYGSISVGQWLERQGIDGRCRDWMRATALGGITGTLRMPMREMFHRFRGNLAAILHGRQGALYWNARPPDAPGGFLDLWVAELRRLGVAFRTASSLARAEPVEHGILVHEDGCAPWTARALFLALPPRALATVMRRSAALARGFGGDADRLASRVHDSRYEHLGITWFFDRPLPRDLPLGGHNVRRGWHPILVQYDQYRPHLAPPAVSAVVGSLSLETGFRHPRLGTRASDHDHDELARILWEDERLADPSLPPSVRHAVYGTSDATQIVEHGPLPLRAAGAPAFLATHLNGQAPYRTASLEAAIQAGAAAARAFDSGVDRLPT